MRSPRRSPMMAQRSSRSSPTPSSSNTYREDLHERCPSPTRSLPSSTRRPGRATSAYDDLRVVVFNGTLKRSPESSHTDGLLSIVKCVFLATGVSVHEVRTVDHDIPPGLWPDMARPRIRGRRLPRHIQGDYVAPGRHPRDRRAEPGWATRAHRRERSSSDCTPTRVTSTTLASGPTTARSAECSCRTRGNEDGGKHVSAQVLYAMQHIGLTVPAAVGRVLVRRGREPGPSYLDVIGGGGGQRVDVAQHGLHDLEPAPHGADAEGRRRHSGVRELDP